jgi:hypothetical protein
MLEVKNKRYSFTLRKNTAGKFAFVASKPDSNGKTNKYLIADCIDPEAAGAFGVQTRKIVKTFFEGSMVFDQLAEAIKSGTINNETGVSALPLVGSFVDVPCGFSYTSEFNGRQFVANTVSLFIMAGENFEVAKARAIRAVEGTRIKDTADEHAAIEQAASAAANAPTANNADF